MAAVFEAFLSMYKHEVADLLRVAAEGAGMMHDGELHPDLVNRLAAEAARCSQRVLNMCIRALDYCPPVDLTFGRFPARHHHGGPVDLKGEERHEFRLAFIDAFRRRGIYPKGIKALSVDAIAHVRTPEVDAGTKGLLRIVGNFLRDYRNEVNYRTDREEIFEIARQFSGGGASRLVPRKVTGLHERMAVKFAGSLAFQKLTGLAWGSWGSFGVADSRPGRPGPRVAVQNLRLVSRSGFQRRADQQYRLLHRAARRHQDEEGQGGPRGA